MAEVTYEVWKSKELSAKYLTGVRGAIPFAAEQIDIMMRVIQESGMHVAAFLDLGCGNGILAASILKTYPQASAVLLDFSEPMIQAAKQKLSAYAGNVDCVTFDYSDKRWVGKMQGKAPFDLIVSGFSIHHQPDSRKREIYAELFELLSAGGLFLNLEHVLPASELGHLLFDSYFIDSLYEMHHKTDPTISREKVAAEYLNRDDKAANKLAPVETQCKWLRQIGYREVDCYFKVFELALFGGRKP